MPAKAEDKQKRRGLDYEQELAAQGQYGVHPSGGEPASAFGDVTRLPPQVDRSARMQAGMGDAMRQYADLTGAGALVNAGEVAGAELNKVIPVGTERELFDKARQRAAAAFRSNPREEIAHSNRFVNTASMEPQRPRMTMDELAKYASASAGGVDRSTAPRQMLNTIEPYAWRYRQGVPGEDPNRQQYGVMAQDLQKSPMGASVVRETPVGKVIDVPSAVGVQFAAQADMQDQINDLRKQQMGRGK